MSKFKVGDRVSVVEEPFFKSFSGSICKSLASVGDVLTIDKVWEDGDLSFKGSFVNISPEYLELYVEEPMKVPNDYMVGCDFALDPSVRNTFQSYDQQASTYDQQASTEAIKKYIEKWYLPELKTKKTIMKKFTDNMKRLLSKKHQTLYKADFLNGDLEFTGKAKDALLDMLLVENEEKLVAKAQELLDAELAEEKKK